MSEILVKIYRGNLVKNLYRGDITVVNDEAGDCEKITYWRSSAKPIQALPVVYSGAADKYKLTEKEIVILASSHSGEEEHIQLIRNILNKIKLSEKNLLCGAYPAFRKSTTNSLLQDKNKAKPIYNPCSGKHAAQLILCKYYGWSINDYYKIEHPVQKMILNVISKVTKYSKKIYIWE